MATQIYGIGRNIHMGMVYIKVSITCLLEEERQKDNTEFPNITVMFYFLRRYKENMTNIKIFQNLILKYQYLLNYSLNFYILKFSIIKVQKKLREL